MAEQSVARCTIGVSREPSVLRITLSGDANLNSVEELHGALADAHTGAVTERCATVVVDMSRVEFMSSSCFRELLGLVAKAEGVAPESRYRIRFVYDAKVHWQRRSLPILDGLDGAFVATEAV